MRMHRRTTTCTWLLALTLGAGGCAQDLQTGVSLADAADDTPSAVMPPSADAGAAEAPPVSHPDTTALFHLLDDFESRSPFGASTQTRVLYHWAFAGDNPNPLVPGPLWELDPPRGSSQVGAHMRGMNHPGGIDIFVDFHPFGSHLTNLVDWRRYAGLAFWARSTSGTDVITVGVVDGSSFAGKREQMHEAAREGRIWHTRRVLTSTAWERHVILFEDLTQVGVADPRPLQAQAINSIHFILGLGGSAFETYIDDVTLLCRGTCPAP
jgi:hypothetical protein